MSVHITREWQDASGTFPWISISTREHPLHTGGPERFVELRKRISIEQPAAADPGDPLLVNNVPKRISVRGGKLWLKTMERNSQQSVVIDLATTAPPFAPVNSPEFIGDPTAPTPPPGDNDSSIATTAFVQAEIADMQAEIADFVQAEIAGFVPWFDAATLAATNFQGTPPPYVDIKCGDGVDQRYQVVADYPVSVVERVGNPDFATTDFWGVPAGSSITGGNLVFTANANVTQTGLKPTVVGGTYEITVNVSSYTSGTLTPQLLTPGTVPAPPAITAAGITTRRITTAAALTAFRLAGTATAVMTVASVSFKRVLTNACIVSADGLIWAPVGEINVLAYGVVADGVTDDTAALLEAIGIATNMGRKALLPSSRMRVTGPIVDFLGSGVVQIEGDPDRSIIVNEMTVAGSLIGIQGRIDAFNKNDIYLTAPAVQGARTLTLTDTSQFTVGQDIVIKDWSQPVEYEDKIYSDDLTRIAALTGQITRVKSINSPTQLGLASQLEFALNIRVALTGTVTTTTGANSYIVNGVGTLFTSELIPHNYITIAGISATFLKVRKIISNTVLWIDVAASPVSTAVSGAVATKLGTVVQRFLDRAGANISGVRFEGSTTVTIPNTNNTISLTGVQRYVCSDLSFIHSYCTEFAVTKALRGKLQNYYSEDAGKPGLDAYCIKVVHGCRGLQIDNAYALRPRHLVTTICAEEDIEPAWVFHTGCQVDEPMLAAYDQHPGARNFMFTGCGCTGAEYDTPTAAHGFELRGRNIILSGCSASGVKFGANLAYGHHMFVDGFQATNCDVSVAITQAHHLDVRNVISRSALTNDVTINAHYWTGGVPPLPDIRVEGRGEGNPSGASVSFDNVATSAWGDDWRLNFRNPDAAVKYSSGIPSSHTHGIIDKSANFAVIANLSCVYRTTGTVTATMPLLSADTGEATYTFTEVSGALTIDGNGAETIDGVASITPTGTVRVKKNGETGAWVTIG